MLHELFLVVCVKVSRHGLRQHRAYLLGVYLRSTLKLEPLICLHIRRLALKPMRFVLGETDHRGTFSALTD